MATKTNGAAKGRTKRKERKNIVAGQDHCYYHRYSGQCCFLGKLGRPELPWFPQEHSLCSTERRRSGCQGCNGAWHEDR